MPAMIRDPRPSFLQPGNESVLDSPMTKAMRLLAQLTGADDPSGSVMGMMAPMRAPSSWLNAAQGTLQRFVTRAAPSAQEIQTLLKQAPARLSNLELDALNKLKGRLRLLPPKE